MKNYDEYLRKMFKDYFESDIKEEKENNMKNEKHEIRTSAALRVVACKLAKTIAKLSESDQMTEDSSYVTCITDLNRIQRVLVSMIDEYKENED